MQALQESQEGNKSLFQKNTKTTKQEYYFLKQGMFLTHSFNKYVVKCRKERHFFDFGKKNREDEEMTYSQYMKTKGRPKPNLSQSRSRFMDQSSVMAPSRKVNTEFDIIDSMLTLSPVSYNQYQVLLQTCFHLQNFNEFLVIERFINETFDKDKYGNDMYCLLDKEGEHPAAIATDLFRTIEEIQISQHQRSDVTMKDIQVP